MPYSEKQVSDKIARTTEAWEEHAEGVKFAEMTLDEFKAKMQPSLDCREKIASLRASSKRPSRSARSATPPRRSGRRAPSAWSGQASIPIGRMNGTRASMRGSRSMAMRHSVRK